MFDNLALHGLFLIVGLAAAWLFGACSAQYIKDKLTGVPTPLRAAITATEASAMAELKAAQAQVVKDVASLFAKAKTALAADLAPKAPVSPAGSTGAAKAAPAAPTGATGATPAPVVAAPVVAAPVAAAPVVAAPAGPTGA
jgi:hypothetical protein